MRPSPWPSKGGEQGKREFDLFLYQVQKGKEKRKELRAASEKKRGVDEPAANGEPMEIMFSCIGRKGGSHYSSERRHHSAGPKLMGTGGKGRQSLQFRSARKKGGRKKFFGRTVTERGRQDVGTPRKKTHDPLQLVLTRERGQREKSIPFRTIIKRELPAFSSAKDKESCPVLSRRRSPHARWGEESAFPLVLRKERSPGKKKFDLFLPSELRKGSSFSPLARGGVGLSVLLAVGKEGIPGKGGASVPARKRGEVTNLGGLLNLLWGETGGIQDFHTAGRDCPAFRRGESLA